jgi:hypothetical protein
LMSLQSTLVIFVPMVDLTPNNEMASGNSIYEFISHVYLLGQLLDLITSR